jgi:Spy/CpxP family protein refolding chaperone
MRWLFPILLTAAMGLNAQPPGQPGGRGFPPPDSGRAGGHPGPPPGVDRGEGKWWQNPSMVRKLGLTEDQQRKLEDIFQQNRLKLIDLTASLEREQAVLDPLLAADHPQESRVLAQFDRVAEARLELEKANARMLWAFRSVLSSGQWKELQSDDPGRGPGPSSGPPPGRR